MELTYQTHFKSHTDFQLEDGVFCQAGFEGNAVFENNYLNLRKREGRFYSDQDTLRLPEAPPNFPQPEEWKMREQSAHRLAKWLRSGNRRRVIEIGCGNGWLINYLAASLPFDFCGIDVGKEELKQAARLFAVDTKVNFVLADIFSKSLDTLRADVFILAGAAQYFSDLKLLVERLLELLGPKGEIHILDSPFYNEKTLSAAKAGSKRHFELNGYPGMQDHYFHHEWHSIQFPYQMLYNPWSVVNRIKRRVKTDSPFPWLMFPKGV